MIKTSKINIWLCGRAVIIDLSQPISMCESLRASVKKVVSWLNPSDNAWNDKDVVVLYVKRIKRLDVLMQRWKKMIPLGQTKT